MDNTISWIYHMFLILLFSHPFDPKRALTNITSHDEFVGRLRCVGVSWVFTWRYPQQVVVYPATFLPGPSCEDDKEETIKLWNDTTIMAIQPTPPLISPDHKALLFLGGVTWPGWGWLTSHKTTSTTCQENDLQWPNDPPGAGSSLSLRVWLLGG